MMVRTLLLGNLKKYSGLTIRPYQTPNESFPDPIVPYRKHTLDCFQPSIFSNFFLRLFERLKQIA